MASLRSEVEDPRAGLFGPRTKLWEVNREAVLFLGGPRAALLQLAHPWVAEAIHQHSDAAANPIGRFHRTFSSVFPMVWGDLDVAMAAARSVHRVHRRIAGRFDSTVGANPAGSRYLANSQEGLLWVHATLWETSITLFETLVRPLGLDEKERYYQETRRFARLFGIEDSLLPAGWQEFEGYNRDMWQSDRLTVGPHARAIARQLFRPRRRWLAIPARRLEAVTATLLPEPIRAGFGIELDRRARAQAERVLSAARHGLRFLPRRLRYLPPYLAAQRRIAGRDSRDRLGEWLHRLYLGPPREVTGAPP